MATHSSVLAWRIPGTGEPGGLPSMGSHRVGHDWSDLAAAAAVILCSGLCLVYALLVCGQSCLTLWDPIHCSLPDFSVHGIFQARILDWFAISYSRVSSQPRDRTHVSCISCIGRRVLYHYAIWKIQKKWIEKGFLKNWKKKTLRKLFKD